MKYILIASTLVIFLAACQIEPLRRVKTEPLPDSTITLEGMEYTLKRNRLLDGPNAGGEGWAIVYNGRVVGCAEANEEWCLKALRAAKAGARDEGGMY